MSHADDIPADLPESVAQEAGEFYENFEPSRPRHTVRKSEAMAHAWAEVIMPWLMRKRAVAQAVIDSGAADRLVADIKRRRGLS